MTNLIDKITSLLATTVVFAAGIAMTLLGLATISLLAFFALAGVGIAVLAASFTKKRRASSRPKLMTGLTRRQPLAAFVSYRRAAPCLQEMCKSKGLNADH